MAIAQYNEQVKLKEIPRNIELPPVIRDAWSMELAYTQLLDKLGQKNWQYTDNEQLHRLQLELSAGSSLESQTQEAVLNGVSRSWQYFHDLINRSGSDNTNNQFGLERYLMYSTAPLSDGVGYDLSYPNRDSRCHAAGKQYFIERYKKQPRGRILLAPSFHSLVLSVETNEDRSTVGLDSSAHLETNNVWLDNEYPLGANPGIVTLDNRDPVPHRSLSLTHELKGHSLFYLLAAQGLISWDNLTDPERTVAYKMRQGNIKDKQLHKQKFADEYDYMLHLSWLYYVGEVMSCMRNFVKSSDPKFDIANNYWSLRDTLLLPSDSYDYLEGAALSYGINMQPYTFRGNNYVRRIWQKQITQRLQIPMALERSIIQPTKYAGNHPPKWERIGLENLSEENAYTLFKTRLLPLIFLRESPDKWSSRNGTFIQIYRLLFDQDPQHRFEYNCEDTNHKSVIVSPLRGRGIFDD